MTASPASAEGQQEQPKEGLWSLLFQYNTFTSVFFLVRSSQLG